jgi:uncharacterized protein YjlB
MALGTEAAPLPFLLVANTAERGAGMLLEDAKRAFEKVTGFGRPKRGDLAALIRMRKPNLLHFRDDGRTPNNPLPLVIYRSCVALSGRLDPAAVFEELFASHGWKDSWRDGMYDYMHFHTQTHEVLGVAKGRVRAQFGGSSGKAVELKAGDVVMLPAGTGHKRLSASRDLLIVGAYPATGSYDEPKPNDIDHAKAVAAIARVPAPAQDPVYGKRGPLVELWRRSRA